MINATKSINITPVFMVAIKKNISYSNWELMPGTMCSDIQKAILYRKQEAAKAKSMQAFVVVRITNEGVTMMGCTELGKAQ